MAPVESDLQTTSRACHASSVSNRSSKHAPSARPRRKRALRLGRMPKLVAIGYSLLGLCASANRQYEVFPFFCWFLFPITPSHVTRYELTPIPMLSALGRLHPTDLHVLIQDLGAALDRNDVATTTALRLRLERNFLVCPSHFAVTRTEYDPLARWATGTSDSSRALAEFTCHQNP